MPQGDRFDFVRSGNLLLSEILDQGRNIPTYRASVSPAKACLLLHLVAALAIIIEVARRGAGEVRGGRLVGRPLFMAASRGRRSCCGQVKKWLSLVFEMTNQGGKPLRFLLGDFSA